MKKILYFCLLGVGLLLSSCATQHVQLNTQRFEKNLTISKSIKTALDNALGKGQTQHIIVTSYRGVVNLSGTINTKQQMQQAIKIAKQTKHVKMVENSLLVASAGSSGHSAK